MDFGGKSIEEIWKDYQDLKSDFEESQILIRELDDQIDEKDLQIQSITQKQQEMRDEIEELEDELTHKDLELQASRKRENKAIRKMNQYRQKLRNLNEEVTDDEVELYDEEDDEQLPPPPPPRGPPPDDSDEENEHWRLRHELNEALIVIESQEQELDEKSNLIHNLRLEIQQQKQGDGRDDDESVQRLRDDLSECKRLIAEQDQELADREDEIQMLEERLLAAMDRNDDDNDRNERLNINRSGLEPVAEEATEKRPTEISTPDRGGSQSSLSSNSTDEGSKISIGQYNRLKKQVLDALKLIEEQEMDLVQRDKKIKELQKQLDEDDGVGRSTRAEDFGT